MAASSSQGLRYVYLALCVVGVLLPYWQFVPWFLQHGFDLPLFLHQLFANRIGGFFGLDVIVASLCAVGLYFCRRRSPRYATPLASCCRQSSGWRFARTSAFS